MQGERFARVFCLCNDAKKSDIGVDSTIATTLYDDAGIESSGQSDVGAKSNLICNLTSCSLRVGCQAEI